MLYKNEEIYDLRMKPDEIKSIEKHFHDKFPVKVTYPSDRIKPSRLPHNRLPDKPASISFPLTATVKTKNGIETWRYAENVLTDSAGRKKYVPELFMLEEKKMLKRNDIELIYFLLRKSEFCLGGDNQGERPKFMFEDLVSEAEKRVEKKLTQQKIDVLLFGDMALPEERLREVASALWINVDDRTFAQVRLDIDNWINKTKDGADKFFDLVNADEELDARNSIQKAINLKLLYCNATNKTWYWSVPGGKDTVICKIPPDVANNTEGLYTYYKGSKDFQEDVKAVLISKKAPAKKEKSKVGSE